MRRALLCTLLFVGCVSTPGADLHNFALRPGVKARRYLSGIATVHKGGLLCAQTATVHGIKFDVDVACSTGVIVWVETRDPRFRTAEGLSIGRPMSDATAIGTAADEGFRLPSGWIAKPNSDGKIEAFSSAESPTR